VTPGRPSPARWLLAAAAAVVNAVVGTVAVVAVSDDDPEIGTAAPSPTTAVDSSMQDVMDLPAFAALSTQRPYYVDPDEDDTTPLRVTFQITAEGWEQWLGTIKPLPGANEGYTMLSITTVTNLVADGCRGHTALDPPVGPTVDDLATALTRLAPFEVTAPPTDVSLLGYEGKHLALKVPAMNQTAGVETYHDFTDCVDGELHSWISPLNDGSFYGYDGPGQTEEFWILDVDGTRLVLVKSDSSESPAEDVAERDAIFDSIRIEP
jgi:hypothetical protein